MHSRSLLGFAVFFVACGGSVVPVDDGKTPSPSDTTSPGPTRSPGPTTTTTPVVHPPAMPAPVDVPPVVATNYSQTCNGNDDCVPFTEIADCGCACQNTAINKSDIDRANRDLAAHGDACQRNNPGTGCGADCSSGHAFCETSPDALVGQCKFTRP